MRRLVVSMRGAVAAALAACAAEGNRSAGTPSPPWSDDDVVVAGADEASDAGDDGPGTDAAAPECSSAGWCATQLPVETAFTFTDVWPLENSAFATGFPPGDFVRGTIAEYDGTAWRWLAPVYHARVVWAPSKDEVWAGGESYLGVSALRRGIRSSGSWTWSDVLPEATSIAGLWGAGPNDVYVHASPSDDLRDRVYHVDGTETSSLVFEVGAPSSEDLRIDRVVGTSPNDVWLVGHRRYCGYLAHKSDGPFVTLVEATPTSVNRVETCIAVGAAIAWKDLFDHAWVYAVAVGPGEIEIAIPGDGKSAGGRIFHIRLNPQGKVEITRGSDFGYGSQSWIANPRAIWSPGEGDVYVAGFGVVLRNPAAFDDAGAFSYSSVMLHGSFLDKQFNAIRGTAANNMWVVGESYAFHKTIP